MFDPLGIVCEFSIGLAGFTGIVAIFANSKDRVNSAIVFRIRNLLFSTFAPGFFALLVISLSAAEVPDILAVRIASGLFGLFLVYWLEFVSRSRRKVQSSDRYLLSSRIFWFSTISGIANALGQFANAFFILDAAVGIFVGGLVVMLLYGATTFAALVMQVMAGNMAAVRQVEE